MIEDSLLKDVIDFVEHTGPTAITILFPYEDTEEFTTLAVNTILLLPCKVGTYKSPSEVTREILSDCEIALTTDGPEATIYVFTSGVQRLWQEEAIDNWREVPRRAWPVFVIENYRVGWKTTSTSLPSSPVKRSTIPFL